MYKGLVIKDCQHSFYIKSKDTLEGGWMLRTNVSFQCWQVTTIKRRVVQFLNGQSKSSSIKAHNEMLPQVKFHNTTLSSAALE